MWKVCAEPTTSAGVGLWNSNSHEERPTSPVTPNPAAAAAHSLFLIPLFHCVHHSRMLSPKQRRRRRGGRRGVASGGEGRLECGQAIKGSGGFGGDQRREPHRFKPQTIKGLQEELKCRTIMNGMSVSVRVFSL